MPPGECTAVYCAGSGILAQNWDWVSDVGNLPVLLRMWRRDNHRRILTMTEPGMVAKAGLNNRGVAVTLNMLLARGVESEPHGLPVHVAMAFHTFPQTHGIHNTNSDHHRQNQSRFWILRAFHHHLRQPYEFTGFLTMMIETLRTPRVWGARGPPRRFTSSCAWLLSATASRRRARRSAGPRSIPTRTFSWPTPSASTSVSMRYCTQQFSGFAIFQNLTLIEFRCAKLPAALPSLRLWCEVPSASLGAWPKMAPSGIRPRTWPSGLAPALERSRAWSKHGLRKVFA